MSQANITVNLKDKNNLHASQYSIMTQQNQDPIEDTSFLGRLKQESSNPEELVIRTNKLLNRPFCSIIPIITLLLSVPMLVIGILYNDQCSIQNKIPIWLIVIGSSGILSAILKLFSNTLVYLRNRKKKTSEIKLTSIISVLQYVVLIIFFFKAAWIITGSVWIYTIFRKVKYDPIDTQNYCNRLLYLFSFWSVTLLYVLVVLPSCFFCCFACCCVFGYSLSNHF